MLIYTIKLILLLFALGNYWFEMEVSGHHTFISEFGMIISILIFIFPLGKMLNLIFPMEESVEHEKYEDEKHKFN